MIGDEAIRLVNHGEMKLIAEVEVKYVDIFNKDHGLRVRAVFLREPAGLFKFISNETEWPPPA